MPDAKKRGKDLDLEAIAEGFRAVGEFLLEVGRPESVRGLVDALEADGPEEFRRVIDGVPEFPGKCLTLCTVVRNVVEGGEVQKVEHCALRLDLTFAERILALTIYERHFGPVTRTVEVGLGGLLQAVVVEVIPPGPYLEELKANNLVTCWTDYFWVPTRFLDPPSWECADLCGP